MRVAHMKLWIKHVLTKKRVTELESCKKGFLSYYEDEQLNSPDEFREIADRVNSIGSISDLMKFAREKCWDLVTTLFFLAKHLNHLEKSHWGGLDQDLIIRHTAQLTYYYRISPDCFDDWDT